MCQANDAVGARVCPMYFHLNPPKPTFPTFAKTAGDCQTATQASVVCALLSFDFFFLLRREERGRIGTVCLFVCFVSVCVLFYLGSFGRRHTLLVRKQRQLREFTVVNAAVQLFVEQSEVLVGTAQDPRFAIARDLQSDQRRALDRSVLVAHAPAAAILVQLDLFNNINTSTLEPNLG